MGAVDARQLHAGIHQPGYQLLVVGGLDRQGDHDVRGVPWQSFYPEESLRVLFKQLIGPHDGVRNILLSELRRATIQSRDHVVRGLQARLNRRLRSGQARGAQALQIPLQAAAAAGAQRGVVHQVAGADEVGRRGGADLRVPVQGLAIEFVEEFLDRF